MSIDVSVEVPIGSVSLEKPNTDGLIFIDSSNNSLSNYYLSGTCLDSKHLFELNKINSILQMKNWGLESLTNMPNIM